MLNFNPTLFRQVISNLRTILICTIIFKIFFICIFPNNLLIRNEYISFRPFNTFKFTLFLFFKFISLNTYRLSIQCILFNNTFFHSTKRFTLLYSEWSEEAISFTTLWFFFSGKYILEVKSASNVTLRENFLLIVLWVRHTPNSFDIIEKNVENLKKLQLTC